MPSLLMQIHSRIYPERIVLETWTHLEKMTKDAGKRFGLLKRVSPYLNPNQRAMIYKSMVRSNMEYVSFVWTAASKTSLVQLGATQRRAVKIIAISEASLSRNAIQPLAQRRNISALTLFHWIYHGDAPKLPNSMLPPPPEVRRATRTSTSHHTAVVGILPSNTAGHKRTFLPTASSL